ncbi:hypothetical protein CDAR_302381 [Caerostris darwini]|uniref:Uncharacterized protein n=1 Tax=Caerostris darwini TaxID=1538125 RepID=A0AAV4UF06_9ARAC|nr:hypothetical protein CDAR_302381 [Caerostris darwini]
MCKPFLRVKSRSFGWVSATSVVYKLYGGQTFSTHPSNATSNVCPKAQLRVPQSQTYQPGIKVRDHEDVDYGPKMASLESVQSRPSAHP